MGVMDDGAKGYIWDVYVKKSLLTDNNYISSCKILEIICDAKPPPKLHHRTHGKQKK